MRASSPLQRSRSGVSGGSKVRKNASPDATRNSAGAVNLTPYANRVARQGELGRPAAGRARSFANFRIAALERCNSAKGEDIRNSRKAWEALKADYE